MSPSSSESSYFEVIRFATVDFEDDTFLSPTSSSYTESEFGLPLSEFSDEDDGAFVPSTSGLTDLEFDSDPSQQRPMTRSQTRNRPRLRQTAGRASLRRASQQQYEREPRPSNPSTSEPRNGDTCTSRQRRVPSGRSVPIGCQTASTSHAQTTRFSDHTGKRRRGR